MTIRFTKNVVINNKEYFSGDVCYFWMRLL